MVRGLDKYIENLLAGICPYGEDNFEFLYYCLTPYQQYLELYCSQNPDNIDQCTHFIICENMIYEVIFSPQIELALYVLENNNKEEKLNWLVNALSGNRRVRGIQDFEILVDLSFRYYLEHSKEKEISLSDALETVLASEYGYTYRKLFISEEGVRRTEWFINSNDKNINYDDNGVLVYGESGDQDIQG